MATITTHTGAAFTQQLGSKTKSTITFTATPARSASTNEILTFAQYINDPTWIGFSEKPATGAVRSVVVGDNDDFNVLNAATINGEANPYFHAQSAINVELRDAIVGVQDSIANIGAVTTGGVHFMGTAATPDQFGSNIKHGDMWVMTGPGILPTTETLTGKAETWEVGDVMIAYVDGSTTKYVVLQTNISGLADLSDTLVSTSDTLTNGKILVGGGDKTIGTSSINLSDVNSGLSISHDGSGRLSFTWKQGTTSKKRLIEFWDDNAGGSELQVFKFVDATGDAQHHTVADSITAISVDYTKLAKLVIDAIYSAASGSSGQTTEASNLTTSYDRLFGNYIESFSHGKYSTASYLATQWKQGNTSYSVFYDAVGLANGFSGNLLNLSFDTTSNYPWKSLSGYSGTFALTLNTDIMTQKVVETIKNIFNKSNPSSEEQTIINNFQSTINSASVEVEAIENDLLDGYSLTYGPAQAVTNASGIRTWTYESGVKTSSGSNTYTETVAGAGPDQ